MCKGCNRPATYHLARYAAAERLRCNCRDVCSRLVDDRAAILPPFPLAQERFLNLRRHTDPEQCCRSPPQCRAHNHCDRRRIVRDARRNWPSLTTCLERGCAAGVRRLPPPRTLEHGNGVPRAACAQHYGACADAGNESAATPVLVITTGSMNPRASKRSSSMLTTRWLRSVSPSGRR